MSTAGKETCSICSQSLLSEVLSQSWSHLRTSLSNVATQKHGYRWQDWKLYKRRRQQLHTWLYYGLLNCFLNLIYPTDPDTYKLKVPQ